MQFLRREKDSKIRMFRIAEKSNEMSKKGENDCPILTIPDVDELEQAYNTLISYYNDEWKF